MRLTIYYDGTSIEQEVTQGELVCFRNFISDNEEWKKLREYTMPYYPIYYGDKTICIMRSAITSFQLDK